MGAALKTEQLVNNNEWVEATNQWRGTQMIVLDRTEDVDFYNIAKPNRYENKQKRIKPFKGSRIEQGKGLNLRKGLAITI